jgi:thiol-disulfide isomerase/thioredoxin
VRKIIIPGLILAGFVVTMVALGMAIWSHDVSKTANSPKATKVSADSATPAATTDSSGAPVTIKLVSDPTPAPPFLANDLSGAIVSSASLRGKVVILNFWATWCPPCRLEIPELIALSNKYKDRLAIIGVSVDEDATREDLKAFVQQFKVNYPVLMDAPQHDISKQFGAVAALPTSFIIDTEGRVVQKHVGLHPEGEYENEVRYLLGLPINAKVERFQDVGQIFLKNAEHATDIPGVDLTKLTPEQKKQALKRMNIEMCTCGCKLTIAQCRLSDDSCEISKKLAAKIVKEVASASSAPATTAKNE